MIVRAAVDFFRGAWLLVGADFFLLVDGVEAFFLLEGELLAESLFVDEVVWAGNPLPCSNNNPARLNAVKRLKNIGRFSLTRLATPVGGGWGFLIGHLGRKSRLHCPDAYVLSK